MARPALIGKKHIVINTLLPTDSETPPMTSKYSKPTGWFIPHWVAVCGLTTALAINGCATSPADKPEALADAKEVTEYYPEHIGDPNVVARVPIAELRRLNLVAVNMVSVLQQIPELEPLTVTLQVARPKTPFGSTLVSAMQEAGFALQLVPEDQGSHYVSYGRRVAETDTGTVTDFEVSIGDIRLTREFAQKATAIFPTSLMNIAGTRYAANIVVADDIFKEQGGARDSFVSGTRANDSNIAQIREVRVNEYDRVPLDKITSHEAVLSSSRQHYLESETQRRTIDLDEFTRYRRAVFIFDTSDSLFLGETNKRSISLLAREFGDEDLLVVKACNDVDGANDLAQQRALRVEEEFASYGLPVDSIYLAPCARTNYRHSADNSPVPVEVILYRPDPTDETLALE